MSFKDFPLEQEYLNEMATSYSDDSTSIIVNPVDSGNLSYFKYCNTSRYSSQSAIARISLLEPEYIYNHNDGHAVLLLSSKAKKNLNNKLMQPSKKYKGYSVFQAVLIDFNIEKFGIYPDEQIQITDYVFGKPLPLNLKQPDYTKLPSEEVAKKKINRKRITFI